ncbi:MAG TPA: fluoride efflux transporter CrcB, partial [Alphaproteobacteria bacterium]|nr:fluoride efflux transporter CrcB [Alphaproteobacteria bacterium]HBA42490.1 fluoride efflux transporter CrcB [Alphaproteobacteria bacterium]
MKLYLAVALGGAIGSAGRYFIAGQMMRWLGVNFPWGTLTVNIVGSFAMGVLIELLALKYSISPEL